jgi:nucleoside-diphosphate-sugar epimerase
MPPWGRGNMTHNILVTGSSGFMGRHLVRLLRSNGYDVLGLDVNPLPDQNPNAYAICDILDKEKLQAVLVKYQPSTVVHLAARTDLDENSNLQGYAVNIEGTKNLIAAIEKAGSVKRALFTSSQLVCRVGYIPKSDTDYHPSNLYGESKILTEKIVRGSQLSGTTWCLLRPTTIWGEGMSPHYQRFLKLVQRGRYVHIGKGALNKSYGYIGNAVHQYLCFIEANEAAVHGKTFYIADYQPLSLREWIDNLAAGFGIEKIMTVPIPIARAIAWVGDALNNVGIKGFPLTSFRLKNILTEYIFDLSSTEEICGSLPFSKREGVAETIKWFVDQNRTDQ